jgi:hypothetical protein
MKMAVFWDVAPLNLVDLTDVSEVLAVSGLSITKKPVTGTPSRG